MEYCLKQIEPGNCNPLIIHLNGISKEIGQTAIPELKRFSQLSPKHAMLRKLNDEWFVYDLNSLHGVVVNGTRISPNKLVKLNNGDVIFFGAKNFEDSGFICTYCMFLKPMKKEKIEVIDLFDDDPINSLTSPTTSNTPVKGFSFKTDLSISSTHIETVSPNCSVSTVEMSLKNCYVPLIDYHSKHFKWPSDVRHPEKYCKRTYSSEFGQNVEKQDHVPPSPKSSSNNNYDDGQKYLKTSENIPGPSNFKNKSLPKTINTAIIKPVLYKRKKTTADLNEESNIGYSQVEKGICISEDEEDLYLDFNSSQPTEQESCGANELNLLDESSNYSSLFEFENNAELAKYFVDTCTESNKNMEHFSLSEVMDADNANSINNHFKENDKTLEVCPFEDNSIPSNYITRCREKMSESNGEMLSDESDTSSVSLHSIIMTPTRHKKILQKDKNYSSRNSSHMSHLDTIFLANQMASKNKKTNTVGKTLLTEAKPMQRRPRKIRGREEGFIERIRKSDPAEPSEATENIVPSKIVNKKLEKKSLKEHQSKNFITKTTARGKHAVRKKLKEIELKKASKSSNKLNEKGYKKPATVKKRKENYGSRALFLSEQPKEISTIRKVINMKTKKNSVSNLNSRDIKPSRKKSNLDLANKDILLAVSSSYVNPSVLKSNLGLNKPDSYLSSSEDSSRNIIQNAYNSAPHSSFRRSSATSQHSGNRSNEQNNTIGQYNDINVAQYNTYPSDPRLRSRYRGSNQTHLDNYLVADFDSSSQLLQNNSNLINTTKSVNYNGKSEFNNVQTHQPHVAAHNNSTKPIAMVASTSKSSTVSYQNPETDTISYIDVTKMIQKIVELNLNWVEEQKMQKYPPQNVSKGASNLPFDFKSFSSYISYFIPMLMLETWEKIYRSALPILESKKVLKKFYFIIKSYENHSDLIQYECESVINKNSTEPNEGTFVIMDLKSKDAKMEMHSIFGYICKLQVVEEFKMDDKSPWKRVEQFWTTGAKLWKFSVFAKIRQLKPVLDNIMKGNVICSIKNQLIQVNALSRISTSPLFKYILKPDRKVFSVINPEEHICSYPMHSDSQKRVIEAIKTELQNQSASKIILLQGPPGTGKTHTIIGLLENLILSNTNQRKKILVTAPSNAAIDEIGCRLIELNERNAGIKFVRVSLGKSLSSRMQAYSLDDKADKIYNETTRDTLKLKRQESEKKEKDIKKLHEEVKKSPSYQKEKNMLPMKPDCSALRDIKINILKETDIVLSTLGDCCQPILSSVFKSGIADFSCCIVDEATQCTEPEILQPLFFGMNKLILVGDPKQLPATVASQMAMDRHFDRSIFERFYLYFSQIEKKNPMLILQEQFRMHSEICRFPSQFFYESKLVTMPHKNSRNRSSRIFPYIIYDILDSQLPNNLASQTNSNEISFISNICSKIHLFHSLASIGIITSCQSQVKIYRDVLFQNPIFKNIEINTVESFQGREKDFVVISCIHANNETDNFQFLSCPRRFNVALTRARNCLIICLQSSTVEPFEHWKELITDAKKRHLFVTVSSKEISHIFRDTMIKKR